MFGYVVIDKPELKVKDFEIYNAVYCSLCRKMGKTYGPLSKFCLNYDFTFLLLIRLALSQKQCSFSNSHCSFNPRKKCFCIEKDNDELKYSYKSVENNSEKTFTLSTIELEAGEYIVKVTDEFGRETTVELDFAQVQKI